MALHNLKIIVVDGGRRSSTKSSKLSKSEREKAKESKIYKLLHLKENMKEKFQSGMTPSSVFAMDMGLRVATQFVKQSANYYLSDIGRKTGDSNYQAMISKELDMYSDILGTAESFLSGAATGSMFGIGGAVVGAIVGMTSSAISIGFKNAETQRSYQHEMFKQETSQQYNLTRANYSVYTGRRT